MAERDSDSRRPKEKGDTTRDKNRPQPGKDKYRGDGSTRRPEERHPS